MSAFLYLTTKTKSAGRNKFNLVSVLTVCILTLTMGAYGQSVGTTGAPCVNNDMVFFLQGGTCTGTTWTVTNGSITSGQNTNSIHATFTSAGTATVTAHSTCNNVTNYWYNYPVISAVVTPSVTLALNPDPVCNGSNITLTASPTNGGSPSYVFYVDNGLVYNGTSASYAYSTTSLSAGTHMAYVQMTSTLTCVTSTTVNSSVHNFTVTAKATPTVTVTGPTTICSSSPSAGMNANVSGGVGNLTYQWYKNDIAYGSPLTVSYTTISPVSNSDRIYCKVSSDYWCVNSPSAASNTYTVSLTSSVTPTVGVQVPKLNYCNGENIVFTATGTYITGGSTYLWSTGATTSSITMPASTTAGSGLFSSGSTVSVTVSNLSGSCLTATSASNSISGSLFTFYNVPNVAASPQTICSGTATSIAITNPNSVPGTTFTWSAGSAVNITAGYTTTGSGSSITQTLSSADGTNNGSIVYTITPSANGCPGTPLPVTVTVKPTPQNNNTSPQLHPSICNGTALNFTPSSTITGTTNTWTSFISGPISVTSVTYSGSGAITNTPNNTGTTAGTVTYTITPSYNGCTGLAVNYVVTVNQAPMPVDQTNVGVYGSGSVLLAASPVIPGDNIKWYTAPTGGTGTPGTSFATPTLTTSTTYYATETGLTSGCESARAPIKAWVYPIIAPSNLKEEVIRTAGITQDNQIYSLTTTQKSTRSSFIDGLARVNQIQMLKASPGSKDVVQQVQYDQFGMTTKSYLPYTATSTNGLFSQTYGVDQPAFYNNVTDTVADDNYPFAIAVYEDSPLRRVKEQGAVGAAWQQGGLHSTKVIYSYNIANEVRQFNPDGTPSNQFYPANFLERSEVTNANGYKTVTYSRSGQIIMKKTQIDQTIDGVMVDYLETYYVYDDFGRTTFIIQPKGVAALKLGGWSLTQTIKDQFVFEFIYDKRGRLTQKKVPGAGWNYIVYDQLNRPVLLQDNNIRAANQWVFIKYDIKGRTIMNGLYTDAVNTTLTAMQAVLNSKKYDALSNPDLYYEVKQTSTTHGYSNQAFPTTGTQVLGVNYYDDYDFNVDATQDYSYTVQGVTGEGTQGRSMNRPTGSKRLILGTSNWLYTYAFYDRYGRVIQTRSNNHLSLTIDNLSTIGYDFEGKALQTKVYHNGGGTNQTTILSTPTYDFAGRLMNIQEQVNGGATVMVVKYKYNELGQVTAKRIHSTDGGTSFLQTVDFRFNIRGWLTSINDAQHSSDPNDFFGMELLYNTQETGLNDQVGDKPFFNGDISAIKWKGPGAPAGPTGQRSFKFAYDKSDKLVNATFQSYNSGWLGEANTLNEAMTYDHNGNIYSLQRNQNQRGLSAGHTATSTPQTIDNLSYTYTGNQLTKVDDATANTVGFTDGTQSTTEYTYDSYGNLLTDGNKKISTVTYNFLGKAQQVTFQDGRYITYAYDAAGTKLTMKSYNAAGVLQLTTDYASNFVYENGVMTFFSSPEGRVATSVLSTNLASNPDCNNLSGFGQYSAYAALTSITQNSQTYIKAVCTSAGTGPGMYTNYNIPVVAGERYRLAVQGYSGSALAYLFVIYNSTTTVWGPTLPVSQATEGNATFEFTVPAGSTSMQVGVRWGSAPLNEAFYVNSINLYKYSSTVEYQYAIADHQGNTRVVFTSAPSTAQAVTATFETAAQGGEASSFQNYPSGSGISPVATHNHTAGGSKSQYLNGGYMGQVGVSKSYKVVPGDQLKIEAYGSYVSQSGTSNLAAFAGALVTAFGLAPPAGGEIGTPSAALNTWGGIEAGGFGDGTGDQTDPKAFVNIVLFDKNYNFLDVAFAQVNSSGAPTYISASYTVKEPGYAFLYVSNEHPTFVDVYFDDVTMTFTPSRVLQYNEYYPFGMQTAESWTRDNSKNNFLYDGGAEVNTTSGWYDTYYRGYDPALGRFQQVDPKAISDHTFSPYNYVNNNPISFTDPYGDTKVYRDPLNPETWAPNPQFGDPFSDSGGGGSDQVLGDYSTYSDADLLEAAQSGSQQAIDEYVSRNGSSISSDQFVDIQAAYASGGGISYQSTPTIINVEYGASVLTNRNGDVIENESGQETIAGANIVYYDEFELGDIKARFLDPSTVGNNLLWLSYAGPWNPTSFTYKDNFSYVPTNSADFPAIGHDRRYMNLGTSGAKGLFTDTRAIGADWLFVAEEMSIANDPSQKFIDRADAYLLGVGLGACAYPKTVFQLIADPYQIPVWFGESSVGVTNKPSAF